MTDTANHEPAYVRQARYLGADAAMASASWIDGMSEADARSVLEDVDPAVLDNYREPNLSGEFAGDPTPASLYDDIVGDRDVVADEIEDAIADAWEAGRDDVWNDALQAHALRVLGRIDTALYVERQLERRMDALREAADR
jgi:hypothetical protein